MLKFFQNEMQIFYQRIKVRNIAIQEMFYGK